MFEVKKDSYLISTDVSLLDHHMVHSYLSERSYWALGRPTDVMERAIENSLCFGIYQDSRQVGFARVITDFSTFAWLCDVFVLEEERGKGLGKWLVECITQHPDLLIIKHFLLGTRDAHGLYQKYGGFQPLSEPEIWMARIKE